mmetsp:Transcript_38812/g.123329  ORF Transcript_38812/g.123329 Transcript_38812/m.123329 type:complete len:129 (+) Transcript_38812:177-563(+)
MRVTPQTTDVAFLDDELDEEDNGDIYRAHAAKLAERMMPEGKWGAKAAPKPKKGAGGGKWGKAAMQAASEGKADLPAASPALGAARLWKSKAKGAPRSVAARCPSRMQLPCGSINLARERDVFMRWAR